MENSRKILIIGSTGHSRKVDSFEWHAIPKDVNLADYHVVILNFIPLHSKEYCQSIDEEFPKYDRFARLVLSDKNQIICISRPHHVIAEKLKLPPMWWLPIIPNFHDETGDLVSAMREDFSYYLDEVATWDLCLRPDNWTNHYAFEAYIADAESYGVDQIKPLVTPIAVNNYDLPIAFRLSFKLLRKGGTVRKTGNIVWLPATTKIDYHGAIDLILREEFAIALEQPPPNWISQFSLPAEKPINERIGKIQSQIESLKAKLAKQKTLHEKVAVFNKILYETGEDVLAPLVRNTLRELDANVTEPKDRVRDDGRLQAPNGKEFTLEIKGKKGNLAEKDIRELDQWVRDSKDDENRESKGLLIVNLQMELHPSKRNPDKMFPANAKKSANNRGVLIVTTTQLYKALVDFQNDKLDIEKFWKTLETEIGICSFTELEQFSEENDNSDTEE